MHFPKFIVIKNNATLDREIWEVIRKEDLIMKESNCTVKIIGKSGKRECNTEKHVL